MKGPRAARDQRTLLLILGLGLIIGWVYFVYIVSPLSREVAKLGRDVRAGRDKVQLLGAATANEAALQEQYRQATQLVRALRSRLPAQGKREAMIEWLSALASQSHVKIQTIFPQPTLKPPETLLNPGSVETEPAVYEEVPIQIDALAGYHQLGDFLGRIESGERAMRVVSLRISASPKEMKRHTVKLLVSAYFATSEDEGGVGVR